MISLLSQIIDSFLFSSSTAFFFSRIVSFFAKSRRFLWRNCRVLRRKTGNFGQGFWFRRSMSRIIFIKPMGCKSENPPLCQRNRQWISSYGTATIAEDSYFRKKFRWWMRINYSSFALHFWRNIGTLLHEFLSNCQQCYFGGRQHFSDSLFRIEANSE